MDKRFFIVLLFAAFAHPGVSQLKFEQEIRVAKSEVPQGPATLLDSILHESKIKWYKEKGYHKISYEAKTQYKGKRLSIEFSEQGLFEDLEVGISSKELPNLASENISRYLSNVHGKYNFQELQIQYSGEIKEVFNHFFDVNESIKNIVRKYEIVIAAKVNGSYELFEYLFDEQGVFEKKTRIVQNITDNIEY